MKYKQGLKVLYTIESENIECLTVAKMQITKSQYDLQMKKLAEECECTKDYEAPLTEKTEIIMKESYTLYRTTFGNACCRVWLCKYVAKNGYVMNKLK
jgi:hypothetical protein